MKKIAPYLMVVCAGGLACLCEATQPTDWARYECIVNRNPFGAKPEPAPAEAPAPAPQVNHFQDLQITALIVGDSGTKVGFVDKRTQEAYFLSKGQSESGIQLVEADFDAESVLLRRNGSEQWVSMPLSSVAPRKSTPLDALSLPEIYSPQNIASPTPPNTPVAGAATPNQTESAAATSIDARMHEPREARTERKKSDSTDKQASNEKNRTSASDTTSTLSTGAQYNDSLTRVYASSDYQVQQNEDGSYKITTKDGKTLTLPAAEEGALYIQTADGIECPVVAVDGNAAIGMIDDDIILFVDEDGEETTIVSQAPKTEDETDTGPTAAQLAMNDLVPTDAATVSTVYSSPDSKYQIAYNHDTGNYALATPDGIYKFQASDQPSIINLPGDIKLQVIASGEGIDVIQLPGDTLALLNTANESDTEETEEEVVDIIPLSPQPENPTPTLTGDGSTGGNSDGGDDTNQQVTQEDTGGGAEIIETDLDPTDVEKVTEPEDEIKIIEEIDPGPGTEKEEEIEPDDGRPENIPPHIWAIMQKADPSMAEER
ncbi:MAG: hypothetical protein EOM20_19345, partial [Spartobacteria bacterium]|nr:hypothetical protein [Spartobacteria bacterium]